MSKTDSDRNLVAALSYLAGFITGLVILAVEKDDKFIRFHAMQSTIIFGTLFILNIVVNVLFGFIAGFVSSLVSVVALVVWVVSMVRAYRGELFKWPIFGNWAERQVG